MKADWPREQSGIQMWPLGTLTAKLCSSAVPRWSQAIPPMGMGTRRDPHCPDGSKRFFFFSLLPSSQTDLLIQPQEQKG